MTRKDNDGQVVIRVHVQRSIIILCVKKTGPDLSCQLNSSPGPPNKAADRTSSVRHVCSRLLCQSIAIDERFLRGYRLTDTNKNNNNKILMTLPLRGFSVTVNYNKNYNYRIIKITMISITKIKKITMIKINLC